MDERVPYSTVLMPYMSGEIGGSHVSGTTLALGLKERFGIRAVVTAPRGAQVLRLAASMGLETIATGEPITGRVWPQTDLLRTPGRTRLLRGLGPGTLVHCNDLATVQAWIGAARLARTPLVYHNRGFYRPRWYNRLLLRSADFVIAISRACDAKLGYLPAGKRAVLTNPFATPTSYDTTATRAGLFDQFGDAGGERLIGFVGNFWKRKRPALFIDAAAQIAPIDPGARFVLFGRAGDVTTEELHRQVEAAGLSGRFLLAGFRLPPEANLAALDLLMMPALEEPFGRTLVEALLLGVPYVAADDAGHGEIHERWGGGVMVDRAAPAASYAEQALRVLGGAQPVALPIERRREIAETLRPTAQAGQVMEVYRRIAG